MFYVHNNSNEKYDYSNDKYLKNHTSELTATSVTGAKTVTTTPTAIFAKTEKKAMRRQMIIYNTSNETIWRGDSAVTTSTGVPIWSGDTCTICFHPEIPIDVYLVADADAVVRVEEI